MSTEKRNVKSKEGEREREAGEEQEGVVGGGGRPRTKEGGRASGKGGEPEEGSSDSEGLAHGAFAPVPRL